LLGVSYLSARSANRPSDDPIFALNREANERRAAGESIVNATVGAMLEDDGSLALLPSVVRALHEVPDARSAAYAPIAGFPDYHAAVVRDLLGGTPLAAQAVAVSTPGGTGALRHAVSTFLDRGQSLVTTSYLWGPYETICEEHERHLRTFPMFDAAGGFHVEALEKTLAEVAAAQGRVLLFINDPCHNPTGYSLSDAEWDGIVRVVSAAAERVPVTLLCDIAYLEFARTDSRAFLRHVAPLAERALVLFAWSGSKAYTSYGVRIGALIACTADAAQRTAVRNALTYACRATWSNCHSAGQLAIARILGDEALHAKVTGERARLRELLHRRADAWNGLAGPAGLRHPRYDGGFFVTVFSDRAFDAAAALRQRGVFVVPQAGALRVALSSVAERDVARLVDEMGRVA
jgi:aromatic-amino-acid transaminase